MHGTSLTQEYAAELCIEFVSLAWGLNIVFSVLGAIVKIISKIQANRRKIKLQPQMVTSPMEEPSDNNIMVLKENTPVGELSDPSNKP